MYCGIDKPERTIGEHRDGTAVCHTCYFPENTGRQEPAIYRRRTPVFPESAYASRLHVLKKGTDNVRIF